jgi:hypothetical protein
MTFTENAQQVFTQLKDIFAGKKPLPPLPPYVNYWRLGHSFDTIIDYLATSPDEAKGFGQIAIEAYNRSTDSAWWYDDFGWWGIASLKAMQHPKLFPNSKEFQQICDHCWTVMYDNAPKVWTHNKNNPGFSLRKPRFEDGVWNADWTKPRPGKTTGNMCKPGDTLCGIQNTVTNSLYLVLATRLYLEYPQDQRYVDASRKEFKFLSDWFQVSDPDQALWMPVEQGAVIRERAATFAEINGKFAPVPGYNSKVAWSGDQGIVLGGLVDRMRLVGKNDPPTYNAYLNRAKAIVAGVKSQATKLGGGTLGPWVTSVDGGDPEDYATGPGVYWRYLQYAYQNNDDLKEYFRASGQTEFVSKNAEHPKRAPDSDDLSDLTNRLAALVAAIVMSRG